MIRVMTAEQLAAWQADQDSATPTPVVAPTRVAEPTSPLRQPELVLGLVGLA